MMSHGCPAIDVVIVSYHAPDDLRRALAALRQSEGVDCSLIVVSNDAEDDIREIVDAYSARLIVAGANIGYGAACNLGLECSTAPWVAFANQDIVVNRSTLVRLIAAVRDAARERHRPAVAGPLLLDLYGAEADGAHRLPSVKQQLCELLLGERRAGARRAFPYEEGGEWLLSGWVPGALIVGNSETFRAVHGFDPDYFMYVEDVDLFRRLAEAEVDCLWVPSARATHYGGRRPIASALHGQALLNWVRYFQTEAGRTAALAVLAAGVVGSSLRALLWALRGAAKRDATAWRYACMFAKGGLFALRRGPSVLWGRSA